MRPPTNWHIHTDPYIFILHIHTNPYRKVIFKLIPGRQDIINLWICTKYLKCCDFEEDLLCYTTITSKPVQAYGVECNMLFLRGGHDGLRWHASQPSSKQTLWLCNSWIENCANWTAFLYGWSTNVNAICELVAWSQSGSATPHEIPQETAFFGNTAIRRIEEICAKAVIKCLYQQS